MQQQRGLARRRRALERRPADTDDRAPGPECGERVREPRGAGDGVELVPVLAEAGCRLHVVVGAQGDDQDVGLVHAGVGRHAACLGIDRRDRLLHDAHAGLRDAGVRQADGIERLPPEHHVQLRVAEHERVALVDHGHVDLPADRLRQEGRKLQAAEARPQDDDPHRAILVDLPRRAASGYREPALRGGPGALVHGARWKHQ